MRITSEPSIVALAGLPGTGKSTLGAAVARALGAPLLDKDRIRVELFGPDRIEYSRAQDDACCREMHARAEELVSGGASIVVLDGRTYSKRYQVGDLEAFAARIGADLALIECTAEEEVIRARLEADSRRGSHPAQNRSLELYLALRRSAEAIECEKLVVDTGVGAHDEHVARCLEWFRARRARSRRS
jgi:predicted kinase